MRGAGLAVETAAKARDRLDDERSPWPLPELC